MQNRWSEEAAARHGADPLSMRVYSSRLLGCESSLVLHGGGNTSVKATGADPFGISHEVLYVKGSGWDLATIEPQGFAPVRLDLLRRLAELPSLSDSALVRAQRSALLDPGAPDPSIEAVLHAIVPFAYVDHTHADAVVAITNTPNGAEHARAAFGPRLLLVPYVMPGFKLARAVGDLTRSTDWRGLDGLILMGHGIFTWGSSAKASYDAMIRLVTAAEEYLDARGALRSVRRSPCGEEDLVTLARVRCDVTDASSVTRAVGETVRQFGGLDILVSNAGVFPRSARIEEMDESLWQDALAINLTSHRRVLQACIPYLRHGVDPSVVVIGSKNVPAPGPGQAAYSASKAGLTQLARVAAIELAADGIRVNVLHPNAVFDTGAWSPEVLAARAAAYGLSVEEYKRNNLLGVEVVAHDVALAVAALVGPSFRRTTGAQIPVDGGNDRVI